MIDFSKVKLLVWDLDDTFWSGTLSEGGAILPDENFSITVMCSFESKFINSQFASLDDMSHFAEEVAPARTFVSST